MKIGFSFLLCLLLLWSCKTDQESRSLAHSVSSFVASNKAVVSFGKIQLKTILDKAEYKKVPKLGMALSREWVKYQGSLDLNAPIYYAMEGPFDEDGNPSSSFLFIGVKNADSLQMHLKKQGFDFDKKGDMAYFQLNDVSLGIQKNLAIIITKSGNYEGSKALENAFLKTTESDDFESVAKLLSNPSDIVANLNIAGLYETSNTALSKLDQKKQIEIQEMVKGSYISNEVRFENGKIIVASKNHFSKSMKAYSIFKTDAKAPIRAKLGKGTPKLAFATNIDMKKLQAFLDEFAPNALSDLASNMGGEFQLALMTGGDDALAGILTGELGVALFGEPNAGSFIPEMNAYVGIGKNGSPIANMAQLFLSNGTAIVSYEGNDFKLASSEKNRGEGIQVPSGCESFGKDGITAYINMEQLDLKKVALGNDMEWLKSVSYITFNYGNDGGELVIHSKKGQENILKTAMDVVLEKFSGQISGINF